MQIESKIPFYNLINVLFTGLAFMAACIFLFWDQLQDVAILIPNFDATGVQVIITIVFIAVAYEVGYIIFRIGGVLLEPLIKKLDKRLSYSDFANAEKVNTRLTVLSREYGFARTQLMLFLLLAVLSGIKLSMWLLLTCLICIAVFILTVRSHTIKINTIVSTFSLGKDDIRCSAEIEANDEENEPE